MSLEELERWEAMEKSDTAAKTEEESAARLKRKHQRIALSVEGMVKWGFSKEDHPNGG